MKTHIKYIIKTALLFILYTVFSTIAYADNGKHPCEHKGWQKVIINNYSTEDAIFVDLQFPYTFVDKRQGKSNRLTMEYYDFSNKSVEDGIINTIAKYFGPSLGLGRTPPLPLVASIKVEKRIVDENTYDEGDVTPKKIKACVLTDIKNIHLATIQTDNTDTATQSTANTQHYQNADTATTKLQTSFDAVLKDYQNNTAKFKKSSLSAPSCKQPTDEFKHIASTLNKMIAYYYDFRYLLDGINAYPYGKDDKALQTIGTIDKYINALSVEQMQMMANAVLDSLSTEDKQSAKVLLQALQESYTQFHNIITLEKEKLLTIAFKYNVSHADIFYELGIPKKSKCYNEYYSFNDFPVKMKSGAASFASYSLDFQLYSFWWRRHQAGTTEKVKQLLDNALHQLNDDSTKTKQETHNQYQQSQPKRTNARSSFGITVTQCQFDNDKESFCGDERMQTFAEVMAKRKPNFDNDKLLYIFRGQAGAIISDAEREMYRAVVMDKKKKTVLPLRYALGHAYDDINGRRIAINDQGETLKYLFDIHSNKLCFIGNIYAYRDSYTYDKDSPKTFCFVYNGKTFDKDGLGKKIDEKNTNSEGKVSQSLQTCLDNIQASDWDVTADKNSCHTKEYLKQLPNIHKKIRYTYQRLLDFNKIKDKQATVAIEAMDKAWQQYRDNKCQLFQALSIPFRRTEKTRCELETTKNYLAEQKALLQAIQTSLADNISFSDND